MRWWHRESWRQSLPVPLLLVALFVSPGDTVVRVLAAWDVYALAYLGLTWLALRGRDPAFVREVARGARRLRPTERYFAIAPDQLSQYAAAVAMIATVLAMPRARDLGTSPAYVLVVCVAAVLTSWVTLQVGFAISYVAAHAEDGGFEFPGTDDPGLDDFGYFAVAVGTTFGATDVTVTSTAVRRLVTVHGVLAFAFNTLILAVAVTILTSYISTP